MNTNPADIETLASVRDWIADAGALAKQFGERASKHDERGEFVAENYANLKDGGFFAAGIPEELGGGGASFSELCGMVRTIGRQCGSTALSFVMHTHTVMANVYKYRRGDEVAANMLKNVAANNLVIATTGANDWLGSSGTAEKVEGGYRVNSHKRFVSGAPGAQVFATSAVSSGPDGDEVVHFAIPIKSEGIRIENTWNALGMRATGSNDVIMESVFVPDFAVVARRPAGKWHPMWGVILPSALPLISAVYVGLAERASELAIDAAKFRQAELASPVGDMLNALTTARIVLEDMVRINDDHGFEPTLDNADAILRRKALVAGAVQKAVELAAELVGGPGFFRGHPVERIVRDVRAMQYHPLPVRRQQQFSGRLALGFDPV
ncbi:MAG: acyl-CoA/acyl-ACP dehydrogenase [Chromatiales bacterium]|jgi:alkylation response protein AidB-like acyl-CoA dehydrogenase|nr:acyl-CoA/acyl-ACP dehydrogenase [Chromatiales bacterium]